MSFALNAIDTGDTYPEQPADAAGVRLPYLECGDTVKLNIWVLNNGVFVQMAGNRGSTGVDLSAKAANWRPEVFLPPGMYSFLRNIERIRFRSSAAGLPANVTVEALVAGE